MRDMPGMECLVRAITSSTLNPGSCPPSPGFAPWATFIWISSALTRYSAVTPNRPDAICFVLLFRDMPSDSPENLLLSSPPSPVLLRLPRQFMASARASCASLLIAPKDMAPVTKCFTISSTGSTSSTGIGFLLKRKKSRMNTGELFLSARLVNSLNLL